MRTGTIRFVTRLISIVDEVISLSLLVVIVILDVLVNKIQKRSSHV